MQPSSPDIADILAAAIELDSPAARAAYLDQACHGDAGLRIRVEELIRMHFLAGRRSWRIGDGALFGESGGVLVLETVAVERFSATPFMVADAVIGLESKLPDVWVAMLTNFVDKRRLTAVRQPLKPRWTNKGRVDYMTRSFPDFGAMAADAEYQDIYRLYPTIIP